MRSPNSCPRSLLPVQVATAIQNGSNPVIAASEALGLQFAFADENGGTGFANIYGPSNAAMPATTAGDTAFAAAAASTVFGSSAAANGAGKYSGYVTSFEAFYTANGISGITNPSAEQIDLAARGAAWGEAIGTALVNKPWPLRWRDGELPRGRRQGTAIYSASLSSQPTAASFQGGVVTVPPFGSPAGPPALLSILSLDQQMELIYIGYFNRSADAGGFEFLGRPKRNRAGWRTKRSCRPDQHRQLVYASGQTKRFTRSSAILIHTSATRPYRPGSPSSLGTFTRTCSIVRAIAAAWATGLVK